MGISRLYIDVETTVAPRNEIVELSYILAVKDSVVKTYSEKIEHEEPITPKGYEIHGIADYMCNIKVNDAILELIVALQHSKQIVAHNASFDISRLKSWNNKTVNDLINSREIKCTMLDYPYLWKTIYTGNPKRITKAYSSLYDCESYLINNVMSVEDIMRGFKECFPEQPPVHHSSAYDSYLVYLIDRHMRNAKKV